MAVVVEPLELRPTFRGVLHRYAASAFATAVVVVLAVADPADRAWIAVYAVCVTAMLTVSSVYHSGLLPERARRVLKRVDHSTILLAIGGSYTGVVGLGVAGGSRAPILVTVWALVLVGVAIRMLWLHAPHPVTAGVYLAVGWAVLVDVGAVVDGLSAGQLALVVLGGALYSVGALVYALHRPNPWPATFGYHEIFHLLVVAAVAAHLAAVTSLATG